MLDERKAAILRAVIEAYVSTAQPVGSAAISRTGALAVSPATIRNEMAVLEREGYLAQPHTSAGRVPTDKGYRFFVDQLSPPGSLDSTQQQRIREFFRKAHGELEQMLADTSQLLADLTDCAAVVVGPPHEESTIRAVHLVGLGGRVALLVVVLSNGVVEKRTLELSEEVGDERLGAASAHLSAHLVGRTMTGARRARLPATGDPRTDAASKTSQHALGQHPHDDDHVFVGGASRMALAFDAVDTVRRVLTTLEQQYVVVSLLREVLDRGLSVSIGTEHGVEPLAECSVVVAPYTVDGRPSGTIGVLGPTRMNYPQAMAAVGVVSRRLGVALGEG